MGTRPGYAAEASGVKSRHSRKGDGETKRFRSHGASCRFLFLAFFAYFAVSSHAQNLDSLSISIQTGTSEQKRDALFQIRNLRSESASRIALLALKDSDPIVRATAASSVVFLPKPEAITVLSELLNDKDRFVRKETSYALGLISDPDAAAPLMTLLQRELDPELRTAAVIALGTSRNPSALPSLIQMLYVRPREETEFLRRSAARSIGTIAQSLRSGDTYVVTPQSFLQAKVWILEGNDLVREHPEFSDAAASLIRVLRNKVEADDTRREAAFALGAIGDKTAIGVLESHRSSSDPYLAEICKEALLKIKTPE